jgi:polyisoprenoid-binding protein YceI
LALIADGALTMRGVTRNVSLPFQLVINGSNALMQGSFTLDRTAFGIGRGQFAGAEPVAKGVTVPINIVARRGS